jgi:hypothetical protein
VGCRGAELGVTQIRCVMLDRQELGHWQREHAKVVGLNAPVGGWVGWGEGGQVQ